MPFLAREILDGVLPGLAPPVVVLGPEDLSVLKNIQVLNASAS